MKRILFLVVGYFLAFQAGISALNIFGIPEYAIILLPLAILSGWGASKLIHMGRKPNDDEPTKELPVPETQPLPNTGPSIIGQVQDIQRANNEMKALSRKWWTGKD